MNNFLTLYLGVGRIARDREKSYTDGRMSVPRLPRHYEKTIHLLWMADKTGGISAGARIRAKKHPSGELRVLPGLHVAITADRNVIAGFLVRRADWLARALALSISPTSPGRESYFPP